MPFGQKFKGQIPVRSSRQEGQREQYCSPLVIPANSFSKKVSRAGKISFFTILEIL